MNVDCKVQPGNTSPTASHTITKDKMTIGEISTTSDRQTDLIA